MAIQVSLPQGSIIPPSICIPPSKLFVKETKEIIIQIVEEEVDRFEDNDLEKRSTQVNLSNEVKRRIDKIQSDQEEKDKED